MPEVLVSVSEQICWIEHAYCNRSSGASTLQCLQAAATRSVSSPLPSTARATAASARCPARRPSKTLVMKSQQHHRNDELLSPVPSLLTPAASSEVLLGCRSVG